MVMPVVGGIDRGGIKEHVLECATQLEKAVFDAGIQVYGMALNFYEWLEGLRLDMFRQVLDMAHAFLDAGMVFVTSIHALSTDDIGDVRAMVAPFDAMVIDLNGDDSLADVVWPDADDAVERVVARILSVIRL